MDAFSDIMGLNAGGQDWRVQVAFLIGLSLFGIYLYWEPDGQKLRRSRMQGFSDALILLLIIVVLHSLGG